MVTQPEQVSEEFLSSKNTIQKLVDLINHPSTIDTIRSVAQTKLDKLLDKLPDEEKALWLPQKISVPTNISEQDLEKPFAGGSQIGELYQNLISLKPGPSYVQFLAHGQIHMLVPPPFQGMSKQGYYNLINRAVPGLRRINSEFIENKGYHFVLSFT